MLNKYRYSAFNTRTSKWIFPIKWFELIMDIVKLLNYILVGVIVIMAIKIFYNYANRNYHKAFKICIENNTDEFCRRYL